MRGIVRCSVVCTLCLLVACAIEWYRGGPALVPAEPDSAPITRALHYLRTTQVTADEETLTGGDYAGDWPQFVAADIRPQAFVRDVSPFMATFVHHALTLVNADHAAALGLTPGDVDDARQMRLQSVDFMLRFEAPAGDPAQGTFGFWPFPKGRANLRDCLLAWLAQSYFDGPLLMGTRSPWNIPFYPADMAIPTDADDTATIYAALLDHAAYDGGPKPSPSIDGYFSDWRDLGQASLRLTPEWLPPASGVFLTYLAYNDPHTPNDVDLVVNANVLYALARYERLDTPGVREAVALICSAVQAGYHQSQPEAISAYYPDNFAFHYCISRAYREGPVPDLRPAVAQLADELEASAQFTADGTAFWDRGDPHLNTAFAILTLLNAERTGPLIDAAVGYLIREQDPVFGNWQEGIFFWGRLDNQVVMQWRSAALTTAMCMEALCRHRLRAE